MHTPSWMHRGLGTAALGGWLWVAGWGRGRNQHLTLGGGGGEGRKRPLSSESLDRSQAKLLRVFERSGLERIKDVGSLPRV